MLARNTLTMGLSPRVRGNPPHVADTPMLFRSIPASAGEPWEDVNAIQGLSPRVLVYLASLPPTVI